jgi:hypothetical protein
VRKLQADVEELPDGGPGGSFVGGAGVVHRVPLGAEMVMLETWSDSTFRTVTKKGEETYKVIHMLC